MLLLLFPYDPPLQSALPPWFTTPIPCNVMHHILLPSEKGHYHLNAAFVVRLSRQTLVDGALREPCATADYNIVCLPLIPTIVAAISFRYLL